MLKRLLLTRFRNYDSQELLLSPGVNLFLGRNGQGKTNVLEAIYYLSLLRSFRTQRIEHLVQFGRHSFTIYGEVLAADGTLCRLGVTQGTERRLMLNGAPLARASEFISHLLCLPFIPEDIDIIKGGPPQRRRFLNITLCQLLPEYLRHLQAYGNALKSRNAMLKQPQKYPRTTVTAYDQQLAEHGAFLEQARALLAKELQTELDQQSALFFPDGRKLEVFFHSGVSYLRGPLPDTREEIFRKFLESLDKNYENDCRDGNTRMGPQRSDLACLIAQKPLEHFGSEGECRVAALALRLAVLAILRRRFGADDITMIVDDVLGELDAARKEAFLKQLVASGQVVFAGTEIPPGFPADAKLFQVAGGRIQ